MRRQHPSVPSRSFLTQPLCWSQRQASQLARQAGVDAEVESEELSRTQCCGLTRHELKLPAVLPEVSSYFHRASPYPLPPPAVVRKLTFAFLLPFTALTDQQRAEFRAAASTRPGFAWRADAPEAPCTRSGQYIAVDGVKIHVRSVLASLCGRPRSSKDRVLRVQTSATTLSQPDEGDQEPDEETPDDEMEQ